jgi:hypothetical protein
LKYRVIESPKFEKRINKLEKHLPRIADFRKGLHITLENDPLHWGIPIPPKKHRKYGAYFIGKSTQIGNFPSFTVTYLVDDDNVYLLDIGAIQF